jgi:2-hydroxy-3-keto-5-methylthiopentenyl-1-phosphate phosphatase
MGTKLKIFCDFDGTITLKDTWMDIGNRFIKKKDKWNEVINKFDKLEIGARECFLNEIALIEDFNFNEFNNIIDEQQIESGFTEFLDFCNSKNLPLNILSEGMDYYIGRILNNNNISLPYFSNRFVLSEDKSRFNLEYPYSDSECINCGCCKRNLLLNMTGDDEISVYIGDGFSDACAVHYADIVFAKKSLASYCWKNNITYYDYKNFIDIKNKLEKILTRKNIKHRQAAKLKRREVFLRG